MEVIEYVQNEDGSGVLTVDLTEAEIAILIKEGLKSLAQAVIVEEMENELNELSPPESLLEDPDPQF